MVRDVEQRLFPFSRDGFVSEVVVAMAQVVRR
jgi:hypothetical protein